MKISLRFKTNLAILVTFLSISIIFAAIELPFQKQRFQSMVDKIELVLQTLVQRDKEALANEIFDRNTRAMAIRLKEMMEIGGLLSIEVFDDTGRLLISNPIRPVSQGGESVLQIPPEQNPEFRQVVREGVTALQYCREISVIGERIGFIRLYYSLQEIKQEQFFSHLIFIGLLGSVLFTMLVVLNFIFSRTIIKPITFLRNAMEQVDRNNISRQVDVHTKDEIGDLTRAFNRMTLELAGSQEEIELRNHELKENEKKIDRVRLYLKNVIDSMPSAMVGVDGRGVITHWNDAAEKLTGITPEKAENSRLEEIVAQTDYPGNIAAGAVKSINRAIKEKSIHKQRRIPVVQLNETRYFDLTVYPLYRGDFNEAVIRIDDVTDHVRMEEVMLQSEKMNSVGGLAAGMAHEINNPIAGILQNAAVIENRLGSFDIPANKMAARAAGTDMGAIRSFMEDRAIFTLLAHINEAGRRAADIVRDMLGFVRKGDNSFAPQFLEKILDETVNLASSDYDLKKKFDFKKIEIVREYDPDLPEILCEKSKLQQVFFNILQNGAQAMAGKRDDRDLPEPARFILRTALENGKVRVEIEDNGPGMDEAQCKQAFEPFFTTKPVGLGTGLGLSIAYFIITENHKGSISVESPPGKGAKFIIKLPVLR